MEKKKTRTKTKTSSDDSALSKAAAWAWYHHGSGSEGKPMREFDITTRTQRVVRPSRYKLEAMRSSNTAMDDQEERSSSSKSQTQTPTQNSLLDSYEIASISKRLDHLIEFSGIKFYDELLSLDIGDYYQKNDNLGLDMGDQHKRKTNKKSSSKLKRFLLRRAVVCGKAQDVDDRAFRS